MAVNNAINNKNNKIGIALVGTGGIARNHIKAFSEIDNAELIGVYGSDFERSSKFANKHGIKVYNSFKELLEDSKVNVVDIINIHSEHSKYGIEAAKAGKHIIVEKPIDISVVKAKELISECKKNGVYLTTIFQHRYDQTIKDLKKIIEKGRLGHIFLASASLVKNRDQKYYDSSGGWRGKKDLSGGGVLINQAIHTIDSLVYLLGEPASVYGETETITHDIEVEDVGVGIIRFRNNALATIVATTSAFARLPKVIEIHGTKGSAIISGETLTLITPDQSKLVRLKNKFFSRFESRLPYVFSLKKKLKPGYHKQNLSAIIEAIQNNTEPPVSFYQGLKSLEIVEAIFKSSEDKKVVKIKPTVKNSFVGDHWKKYLAEAKNIKPKVLLLNPLNATEGNVKFSHIGKHRLRQPLGLAYVSSFLKKITQVQLVDAAILNWKTKKIIEYVNLVNPEILIISSSPLDRWQNPDLDISSIFKIIDEVKVKNKILIGTHGSVTPDWIFENCKVDFVVRSEPELTCVELVQNILATNNNFSQIIGLSFRQSSKVTHNPARVFTSDLDDYPFPDYESLPMSLYRYTTDDLPSPFSLMLTSRGCPGQCIFCLKKMMPDKYRARSAENIYQEIIYLENNFGVKSFYFQDWEFLIDKERVEKLCQLLIDSSDLEIFWGCSARATSLDQKIIALMKKAGCVLINFGYESGSSEILKSSKKGVSVGKMEEVVSLCQEQNIKIRSFCLVNLPGENRKTLKESAEFISQNNLNVPHVNMPIPYPGTELAKMISCTSWEEALKNTGKVDTNVEPEKAKRIFKNYIWQGRFGKLYLINPKFWLHILNIIKKKL